MLIFGPFGVIFGPFFGAKFFWSNIYLCYFYYFLHLCRDIEEAGDNDDDDAADADQ